TRDHARLECVEQAGQYVARRGDRIDLGSGLERNHDGSSASSSPWTTSTGRFPSTRCTGTPSPSYHASTGAVWARYTSSRRRTVSSRSSARWTSSPPHTSQTPGRAGGLLARL